MGRLFGIVLFVLALWFAADQFVEARPADGDTGKSATIPHQTRDKVVRAHEAGNERRRKLLGE